MSGKSGTVKKAAAAGGLLVAACAACCAPLVVAPLVALFAAGGLGLALVGQIGLGIVVLGGIGTYVFLRRRAVAATKPSCGCGTEEGRRLGEMQALPNRQS